MIYITSSKVNPSKNGGELMCSGRVHVGSSISIPSNFLGY